MGDGYTADEIEALRERIAELEKALKPFVDGLAFDDDEPDRCGWCAHLLAEHHHPRCPMPAAMAVTTRREVWSVWR